jgi:P4 family phage/plasmid primase-like protien
LLGSGANGKSKFIDLCIALVGEDNCCHLSLHDIEEDKFARARLFGKVLNTYADNKGKRLKETGNLKTVISGDSIEAQEKFKPRFSLRNKAKILISTNNPPESDDRTYAFYRRWKLTDFGRTFVQSDDPNDPNKKDPDIIHKLTTVSELSGFLNLLLRYLPVLINEGGFVEESMQVVQKKYEYKADHVAKYLQEHCVIDHNQKGYWTRTSDLYQHYVKVCNEYLQVTPLEENVFGSKLVEHGIQKKRHRIKGQGGVTAYFYEPIMLRHVLTNTQGGGLFGYAVPADTTTTISQTEEEEEDQQPATAECPYCAVENMSGNSPIASFNNDRECQIHIVLEHPGLEFDDLNDIYVPEYPQFATGENNLL